VLCYGGPPYYAEKMLPFINMVEDNILVNGNNYSWINWIKDNSRWTTTKRKQAKIKKNPGKKILSWSVPQLKSEENYPLGQTWGLVSKETVVLHHWGSETQNFRFINWVDKVNWLPTDSWVLFYKLWLNIFENLF